MPHCLISCAGIAILGAQKGVGAKLVRLILERVVAEAAEERRVDFFYLVDSIVQCSMSQVRQYVFLELHQLLCVMRVL